MCLHYHHFFCLFPFVAGLLFILKTRVLKKRRKKRTFKNKSSKKKRRKKRTYPPIMQYSCISKKNPEHLTKMITANISI